MFPSQEKTTGYHDKFTELKKLGAKLSASPAGAALMGLVAIANKWVMMLCEHFQMPSMGFDTFTMEL